jgi:hypothetical protein
MFLSIHDLLSAPQDRKINFLSGMNAHTNCKYTSFINESRLCFETWGRQLPFIVYLWDERAQIRVAYFNPKHADECCLSNKLYPSCCYKFFSRVQFVSKIARVKSKKALSTPVVPKLFRSTAPLVPYTHPQRPPTFFKKTYMRFCFHFYFIFKKSFK